MKVAPTIATEAIMEHRMASFLISTNRERLDLDVIHGFLTNCLLGERNPARSSGAVDRAFTLLWHL